MRPELTQAYWQQVWLRFRWQVARLGVIGKIGVGLFVVSVIFFLAAVLPQQSELKELKDRAVTLQQQIQQQKPGDGISAGQLTGDQALQVFYEFFPRVDSSPFWIRELVRVAKKRGVRINSSEYRLVEEQGSRLARYEMTLPVYGEYSKIRAFMADALQAVPAMAIEGIAIERDNVKSAQIAVRLEINLYLNQ